MLFSFKVLYINKHIIENKNSKSKIFLDLQKTGQCSNSPAISDFFRLDVSLLMHLPCILTSNRPMNYNTNNDAVAVVTTSDSAI
jgi:hypothetical protein